LSKPVIGIVGMTHLGLVTASAIASKGFSTICYDGDEGRIAALERHELPVSEPDLDTLLADNGDRQRFTADLVSLAACDIVYVAQDVPTDAAGKSDLSVISRLISDVCDALNSRAVLVILCQVPPGFTRALNKLPSNRLYYQAETLIFGRAVAQALHPERFIVGCTDPRQPFDLRFASLLQAFKCPILSMRYESAEMAKIAINMCLVSSISFANMLAELCEKIGADWSEIAPAMKLDHRIGAHAYLTPGLGIAGGNLERDLASAEAMAAASNLDVGLIASWRSINARRRDWAANTIHKLLLDRKPDSVLAIWGLAYKENTNSVKNSPSLSTIAALSKAHLRIHDPIVSVSAVSHPHIESVHDPLQAVRGAAALLILTPWPQYRAIAPADIAKGLAGRIVLDPYGVLDAQAVERAGLIYYMLGRPTNIPD
jgi:UDPglucose 6-dehydrogenase